MSEVDENKPGYRVLKPDAETTEKIKKIALAMSDAIPDDLAEATLVIGALGFLLHNGFTLLDPAHALEAFDSFVEKQRADLETVINGRSN